MSDVTRILEQIELGEAVASERLFPAGLRRAAQAGDGSNAPGEAGADAGRDRACPRSLRKAGRREACSKLEESRPLLRRRGGSDAPNLDRTRAGKRREKRGGDWKRVDFENFDPVCSVTPDQLVTLDDALARLNDHDKVAGQLVSLRYFAGLSLADAAQACGSLPGDRIPPLGVRTGLVELRIDEEPGIVFSRHKKKPSFASH